ncbi:MAG: FlgD immunoglobulin-like domain containing protein, partial [candidate division WOR-3 bacterium]
CGVNPDYLVCEALVFCDVDNTHLVSHCFTTSGDGERRLFNLDLRPLQAIDSILINNARVPRSDFCCDPLLGWVSFSQAPPAGSSIQVFCRSATHPDLAVTNWDPSHGNYLFKNTTGQAVAEESARPDKGFGGLVRACPNPGSGPMHITLCRCLLADYPPSLEIYSQDGRLVRTLGMREGEPGSYWAFWDGTDKTGQEVPPGIYFATISTAQEPTPPLKLIKCGR